MVNDSKSEDCTHTTTATYAVKESTMINLQGTIAQFMIDNKLGLNEGLAVLAAVVKRIHEQFKVTNHKLEAMHPLPENTYVSDPPKGVN